MEPIPFIRNRGILFDTIHSSLDAVSLQKFPVSRHAMTMPDTLIIVTITMIVIPGRNRDGKSVVNTFMLP